MWHGCHLSALHQSPAPVQPRVHHEKGVESSVRLCQLAPLGAVDLCSQQAGSGAERGLAGWWDGGGALQPGQPARLPGTPSKAALGHGLHLDFVEHADYTRSHWDDTKPKCPYSPRLQQALPGATHSRLPLCELSPPAHWTQRPVIHCQPRGMRSYWHVPSPWLPASGTHEFFHF